MVMELLRLSKFKLQLQAVLDEFRELRERERSLVEQNQDVVQKQKRTEEECNRKMQDLQAEVASSKEECKKLKRKVSYLQNDNELLENKQRELNGTIQNLLQSREGFIDAYEESTSQMKRSIESKDRKLGILSEKLNSHLSLFDSIQKEVSSVQKTVDTVHNLVKEKEDLVGHLKSKFDQISSFEPVLLENITNLQNKLKFWDDELRRKNQVISDLEAKLEMAKVDNNFQNQIEVLQKTLSMKDLVIQNLISENEALHFEVENIRHILHKIQETVKIMNEEDQRAFCSLFENQEGCAEVKSPEITRNPDALVNDEDKHPEEASIATMQKSEGMKAL